MRIVTISLIALAVAGCQKGATTNDTTNEVLANDTAIENVADTTDNSVLPAAMSLNETTWTYTDKDGKKIEESIDAAGNYISTAGTAHDDHGTYVAKDGKACFTSAMNSDGESCWTVQDVAVGGSFETVSDKGEKMTVTRTAYVPKQMPAK